MPDKTLDGVIIGDGNDIIRGRYIGEEETESLVAEIRKVLNRIEP